MPPILVPSSAKRIATQMLVTEKVNGRKGFVLRGFVCDINRPSKKLPVQSYLLKHKNKVWKLLWIKHEDNDVASVPSLLTVNIFPTCSNCWLWTGKRPPGSLCWSILKFINKLHLNLYLHSPTGESVRNFLRRSLLQTLILGKKMRLIFKMTYCTFVFFVKLIRSYLT